MFVVTANLLRLNNHKAIKYSLVNKSAWSVNSYGGIESLNMTNFPVLRIYRTNEVIVRVHAASVNPIDLMMIEGYGRRISKIVTFLQNTGKIFPRSIFPLVPGRDFSGVVTSVGQCCSKFKVGDRVWGSLGVFKPMGSHSTFIKVKESELSHRPNSITDVEAAAIPFVANTFFGSLGFIGISFYDLVGSNLRCLVLGSSGGVGSFAVQYLKFALSGGSIVATCKSHAIDFVTSLNADFVVDSSKDDYIDEINYLGGDGYDLVLNFLPTTDDDFLKKIKCSRNGKFVSTSSPFIHNFESRGLTGLPEVMVDPFKRYLTDKKYIYGFFKSDVKALDYIGMLIDDNKIISTVDSVYDFDSLPTAYHRLKEGGVLGKVVINIK